MDRALQIPFQGVLPGQGSQKRPARGLQRLGCLVGLCLLLQLFLTLPVLFLLRAHFRQVVLGLEPAAGRYAAQTAERSRLMIHLRAEKPKVIPSTNYSPILHWDGEDLERFQYSDGVLEVPEEGDYFIYSRVTFESRVEEAFESGPADQNRLPLTHLKQHICRGRKIYGSSVPDSLLSGSTTVTTKSVGPKCKPWRKAIYLGAVFHLHRGDRLMVNVSHIELVKLMETFFGLAALN